MMCNQCVTNARQGADNADPRRWICGRCGVLLSHPQEGHDCIVWVRDTSKGTAGGTA